jgi:hypothetical protein
MRFLLHLIFESGCLFSSGEPVHLEVIFASDYVHFHIKNAKTTLI